MSIADLIKNIKKKVKIKKINIRPGEKLHELLINSDEMRYAWEYENLYMILNWQFDQAYLNKNYSGMV